MSNELKVSLVPKEYVDGVWGEVVDYMQAACEHTEGRYEAEDVYTLIMEYDYILWIAFDDTGVKGAVVTGTVTYPRKKFLLLMFCGGVDGFGWKDVMLDTMQRWAKTTGCDGIEASGRIGWGRIFKSNGYKPVWQTFELPISQDGSGA